MSENASKREGSALVTGGSRGIGAAVARSLGEQGWSVGVNYRSDSDGAEEVAGEIASAGGTAVAVQGDVGDPDSADKTFKALEERFGPVLVLVNNAGLRQDGLAPQLSDEMWDSVIETNLSAAFRTTRRALGPMLRARFGRIVNMASIVGPNANAGQANYAASKAGLIGMTKTVAVEVARRGITVNAVAPGFVQTKLTEDVDEAIIKSIPARRAASAEEVAACVGFLASEQASYVTGTTLVVDGGMSA